MVPVLNNRTIHFKNRDIGYQIVERLLELERKSPKYFGYADILSKEEHPKLTAKILPFPEQKH